MYARNGVYNRFAETYCRVCVKALILFAFCNSNSDDSLYLNPKHSDLTVICGDEVLPVHQNIVCTQSDYFARACGEEFHVCLLDLRLPQTPANQSGTCRGSRGKLNSNSKIRYYLKGCSSFFTPAIILLDLPESNPITQCLLHAIFTF